MVSFSLVSFENIYDCFTSNLSINPLKILVLFLSISVLSIFLDETGFFKYIAYAVLKKSKNSQKSFFVIMYLLVSILTVFTSNDIVILTFTPFIIYYSKNANVNPVPYLFAEFVGANTWSMLLIIGNPTNIYLATFSNIDFFDYFMTMIIPTVGTGILSLVILLLIFKKDLSKETEIVLIETKIKNKLLFVVDLVMLISCIILLAISNYIGFEMWLICLVFSLVELFFTLIYILFIKKDKEILFSTVKRIPYSLIPFVLSMFIVVLGVTNSGLSDKIIEILNGKFNVISYGLSSFICANLLNNIPMSVLYSSLCVDNIGVYSTIISSNLGAILTPVGALAGIMWCNLLKEAEIKFSFIDFTKKGVIVSIPCLCLSLFLLFLVL